MEVQLINYTENPEKTIAQAARLCYSSKTIQEIADFFDKEKQVKFIDKIMRLGHYSVLEHASFTFGIEGISRVASHQFVRHRIASFSQRSQRYVKIGKKDQVIIPRKIQDDKNLLIKFKDLLAKNHDLYQIGRAHV